MSCDNTIVIAAQVPVTKIKKSQKLDHSTSILCNHNSKLVIYLIFIDHTAAVMATYTIIVNMVYSAFTLAEMTILKCLYISKWSKMAMIEDDFLARILAEFNLFISITMTLIRIYLDEPMNNLHYIRLRGFQQSNLPEKYQTSFSTINTW